MASQTILIVAASAIAAVLIGLTTVYSYFVLGLVVALVMFCVFWYRPQLLLVLYLLASAELIAPSRIPL